MIEREQVIVPRDVVEALPHYLFVIPLGTGGQATVYKAVEPVTNRTVAVKVFRTSTSVGSRRRFLREVDLLERLEHPHIIKLLESGTLEDGRPFLVTACIDDALDISTYCWSQALSTAQRIALARRVCDAVAQAHEQGLVHRDLKPPNVVVDSAGSPFVLDFGLATNPADSYSTSRISALGTLPYMAPEQTLGRGGTRADVYALGALLYEILIGQPVLDVTGLSEAAAMHRVIEPDEGIWRQQLRAVPADLAAIVLKALARDSRHRYADARELDDDLARWQAGCAVHARAGQFTYACRSWVRRHHWAATGILLAAVAAGVFSWGWLQRSRLKDQRAQNIAHLALGGVLKMAGQDRDSGREEQALDAYRSVIANGLPHVDGDEQARAFVVEAYRRYGELLTQGGRHAEAIEQIDAGLALVAAVRPMEDPWLKLLAALQRLRARALSHLDRVDEGLTAIGASIAIRRDLLTRDPNNTTLLNDLAMSVQMRGTLLRRNGQPYSAHAAYLDSYRIRMQLLALEPEDPSAIISGAYATLQLGVQHLSLKTAADDAIAADLMSVVTAMIGNDVVYTRYRDRERLSEAVELNLQLINRRLPRL